MRIVIVEDEIRTREGIAKLIDKLFSEHEVIGSALNGEEGLELILRKDPDLIITDVRMPIMDGLTMLSILFEKKVKSKAIVLSAYAEFSYAQQAMRWGVSEYLIKPLVVSDFAQAIKNIEMQIAESKLQSPDILGRLDHILFGLIFSGIEADEKLSMYLENKYGMNEHTQFSEVPIYLGEDYAEVIDNMKYGLKKFLEARKDLKYCLLEIPKERMLLIILYGYEDQHAEDQHATERWFQNGIISQTWGKGLQNGSYGWINAVGIKVLKASYQKLRQYMDWNISFGNAVMISYPKILQVQTTLCIYPIDIENRLKAALCSLKMDKVLRCIEKFNEYFENGKIYAPKEIKESYVRFLWAMMNVAKEIGELSQDQVDQKKILERIMSSMNKKELNAVAEETFLCIKKEDKEDPLSLNVKRAENMIHEYFQTGITLEEIAAKLNITPEYLGMQFRKEKGVTFSTYMKDFRITKAKKLLIGSKLKVFEVAEKVGYSDAKYFSRVFRENTGQLPAEYRKTNK
ncbi:MAG: response regulator [Lachnospiraceae bacterium]|jgi:two-component system response regulator YesN|nr:response regulator [Lachnospiraceae bacterium]